MSFRHPDTSRKKHCFLVFLLLVYLGISTSARGQGLEYQVKAGFLGKFAEFIEWPRNSNVHDSTKPFIIAVIGKNPFGNLLEEIYGNSRIKNKPVKIRYLQKTSELKGIDLLYIAPNQADNLTRILADLKNQPTLTVSDHPGFCEKGVIINMYNYEGYVRFEINLGVSREKQFSISSRLLKLARIINWMEGEL